MSEIQMYTMQTDMEHQHLTEDSKVRVYLSTMREKGEEKKKDSMPEKIVLLMIKVFFSYSIAYFVSPWAVWIAYRERGYEAYGGEYILIFVAFIGAYYAISIFFKYFRREKA